MKAVTAEKDGSAGENERLIRVEGMMCEHCEKRVRDCLEAFENIEIAIPDYKTGTVKLTVKGEPDMKEIRKAISSAGYKLK